MERLQLLKTQRGKRTFAESVVQETGLLFPVLSAAPFSDKCCHMSSCQGAGRARRNSISQFIPTVYGSKITPLFFRARTKVLMLWATSGHNFVGFIRQQVMMMMMQCFFLTFTLLFLCCFQVNVFSFHSELPMCPLIKSQHKKGNRDCSCNYIKIPFMHAGLIKYIQVFAWIIS